MAELSPSPTAESLGLCSAPRCMRPPFQAPEGTRLTTQPQPAANRRPGHAHHQGEAGCRRRANCHPTHHGVGCSFHAPNRFTMLISPRGLHILRSSSARRPRGRHTSCSNQGVLGGSKEDVAPEPDLNGWQTRFFATHLDFFTHAYASGGYPGTIHVLVGMISMHRKQRGARTR